MTSQAAVLHPPTKQQIAHKIAGVLPAELSPRAAVGILGVGLGAGICALTGRMLGLGLADLKGSLGISYDDGAWIDSAYNVSQVFIVVFSVYLGGWLTIRRVLLYSAWCFTVICLFLPLIHSYSLLILALVVAGLTSGTFWPLAMSFMVRNLPLRFLPFGAALYAVCLDGAANIGPSLYGWYRDHLSFHWMFWNSALLTPIMIACLYYGIPATPAGERSGPQSFVGFLYASAGFALLYAALDQGTRLDWWRSGLFNSLFFSAMILLLAALIRRLRSPSPLADLPSLRHWNTILLSVNLASFKFCFLGTVSVVSLALAIHGFEADQVGPAFIWIAFPQFLIAFIAALLLLYGLDARLLMAIGFFFIAAASILNAQYTFAWSAANFYRTELLMGVGQSFALVGLVCSIVLQAFFGGLSTPQAALTFAAFFHTVRLLGGEIGQTLMGYYLTVRERVHSNLLGLHVQRGDWFDVASIHQLTAGLYGKSSGLATGRAIDLIGARVRLQAYTLTVIDGFYLIGWACFASLLIIALLRKSPLNYGELAFPDANAPQQKGLKS